MDKDYASVGKYEAIDYGTYGLVFYCGREFATFSIPPEANFFDRFDIWLDELPADMLR